MSETCYKVVVVDRDFPGDFKSSVVTFAARTRYRIGEWTTAPAWLASKGYHILVYDNLSLVPPLVNPEVRLFICECEEEVKDLPQALWPSIVSNGMVLADQEDFMRWPSGTRMFKRVKLTQLIAPLDDI